MSVQEEETTETFQFKQEDFDLGADEESLYEADDEFDGAAESDEDTVTTESVVPEKESEGDDRKAAEEPDKAEDDSGLAPAINTALIIRAAKLGLSEDKINAFKDGETLAAALDLVEATTGGATEGGTKEADIAPVEWYKLPETLGEEFDEKFVDVVKGMNAGVQESVQKMLDSQRQEFSSEVQALRMQKHHEDVANFDDAVSDLGDSWADVLGKGSGMELEKDSEALKNRSKLFDEVMSGKHAGSMRKRIEAAAKAVFTEKATKIASDKTVERVRNRQGKFMSRPSSRKESQENVSPMRRALNNVKAKMREFGSSTGDDIDMDEI